MGSEMCIRDRLKDNSGYELVGGQIDINDKIGIGIRQNEGDLKKKFDDALAAIRADGTYLKISTSYFGADIF